MHPKRGKSFSGAKKGTLGRRFSARPVRITISFLVDEVSVRPKEKKILQQRQDGLSRYLPPPNGVWAGDWGQGDRTGLRIGKGVPIILFSRDSGRVSFFVPAKQ